jgi:hypothetical protein
VVVLIASTSVLVLLAARNKQRLFEKGTHLGNADQLRNILMIS